MTKLKTQATCNGCRASEEATVCQDLKLHAQVQQTYWVRPPRGWFVTTAFFLQEEQMRCANVFLCARCMEAGRVADVATEASDQGQEAEQKPSERS